MPHTDGSLKFQDGDKRLALHAALLYGEGARQQLLKGLPIEGGIATQLITPVLCDFTRKTAGMGSRIVLALAVFRFCGRSVNTANN
jgi:hypothetical protein